MTTTPATEPGPPPVPADGANGEVRRLHPMSWLWWLPPACALPAALFGAWLGWRRYRHTRWLLDADGFGLRRGRLWQSDTRVPGSRVQHLDIRRGPLERHFRLATLVIHTAGTRHSEVSVSGLAADDAERLRDHLARQTDDDDDDAGD